MLIYLHILQGFYHARGADLSCLAETLLQQQAGYGSCLTCLQGVDARNWGW